MIIKIGATIKRLRIEKNITQETLATAIGVTPQAISRWESEGGYPDIELLPSLADFFSISTDVLLGYKLSEREREIADIKKEMEHLSEVGDIEERVTFARNAIAKYPSNCEFKENLADSLYLLWYDTHDETLLSEIENLCAFVVSECKDERVRYDAINTLIRLYSDTRQCEKALAVINLLTPIKYCREFAKSYGIGDGNTELYVQDEINKLTDCLGIAIRNYVLNEDLPNDPSTWDRKIEMLNISNQLYRMIYGDNLMFNHTRLSYNYWLISTYEISQKKRTEALSSLDQMCYHAVEYDKAYINDHGKNYTSILTDKLIYPAPSKDFHELKEHTNCYHMLERLKHNRYDSVRTDERFNKIIAKLKEYAR